MGRPAPRGWGARVIAVVLPTLDTPDALGRVLDELPDHLAAFVVDDGSREPVQGIRPRPHTFWIRHDVNRGYGAAQKSGFAAALAAGASRVVLLHGDGQYATAQTVALAEALDAADGVLGSRFPHHAHVIPAWRRWGNRGLTALANARFGTSFSELHTGARAYSAEALRSLPLEAFSDDFVFDQQVLAHLLRAGRRIVERPVATHYGSGSRSISFRRSVRYGVGCVRTILASE
jgi:glycosyltransferase involved in cell wall biosynthesis